MNKSMICALFALAGSGVLTTSLDAHAQADAGTPCSSLTNPVYIGGSSASQPIWAALAPSLPGVTIVYQSPSSCVGLSEVMSAATDPSSTTYYSGTTTGTCTGQGPLNIGVSDVFPASCNTSVMTGFKEFLGPVQVMLLAAPYESTATSISADAAYTVFGWGGTQYPVMPWTDYTQIFIRTPTSGTENMIGSAIGLAATKWLSQTPDAGASQESAKSSGVLTGLLNAGSGPNPSAAIGIIAADLGDERRGAPGTSDAGATGGLKILAFQAKDQTCGYLPDSDATHYDKINVRQGRYDIWGPLHLVTAVDSTGTPTNAGAATIINYITANGLTDAQLQTVIQVDANAHVIPQCAMQVSRSAEVSPITGGGEASYQPPEGCGCYYESLKNGGQPYSNYCKSCSTDSDCSSTASYPKCHFGYCEAQ